MSDMGDIYAAMKERTRQHRTDMLAKADTEGWTKHTPWHFSRNFNGKRFDWWPSGGKARYDGRMICGHSRVNAMIDKLTKETTSCSSAT